VLQTASCPVLIIRAHAPSQPNKAITLTRISVLLDGSTLAEQALPLAVALAKATKATLQLVRIASTYRERLAREERGLAIPYYEFMVGQFAKLEQDACAYLMGLTKRLDPEGLTVG
jgi:nucleotide-binding universal stress UspA family protein